MLRCSCECFCSERKNCFYVLKGEWTMRELVDSVASHLRPLTLTRENKISFSVRCLPLRLRTSLKEREEEFRELAILLESATVGLLSSFDASEEFWALGRREGEREGDEEERESFYGFFAELVGHLKAPNIYFDGDIFADVEKRLRSVIERSPSSYIDVVNGIPTELLCLYEAPREMTLRGNGDFAESPHLQRLCTSSIRRLLVDENVTLRNLEALLAICKRRDSSLLTVDVTPEDDDHATVAFAKKALRDSRHYIVVSFYSQNDQYREMPSVVLSEEEWRGVRGLREFFTAAASSNGDLASAHGFLNTCGRDLKRKIASYLF